VATISGPALTPNFQGEIFEMVTHL
jgi:hypothetical protein